MVTADLLGSNHPLARATRRLRSACLHLLYGAALLPAIAVFAPGPARRVELGAAGVTCVLLGGLALAAWGIQRQHALQVIIAGGEDLPLGELEPVRRRLSDPRRRLQLAASFDRYLRAATQWHRTPPQLRPPANVRMLLPLQDDVREIARLLRADTLPRVRGVALCERLLTDGATSPLYSSDPDALRRELGRIRFALAAQ
jgi:hypothetical protein